MGTCGSDYTDTDTIGYILIGAALSDAPATVPTLTQACNAIQVAEALINGHLMRSTSYTTVPTPITAIAIKIVLNIIQVQKWWGVTEGAVSDTDYMGTASYPSDLLDKIMTPEIKKELDAYKRLSKYYEDDECNLIFVTPQDSDIDFSEDQFQ